MNPEKAKAKGIPVIPKQPNPNPIFPYAPNPAIAVCSECGLELKQIMGYVCNHPNCPCFPRITCTI
jgi:hypothetical protein